MNLSFTIEIIDNTKNIASKAKAGKSNSSLKTPIRMISSKLNLHDMIIKTIYNNTIRLNMKTRLSLLNFLAAIICLMFKFTNKKAFRYRRANY